MKELLQKKITKISIAIIILAVAIGIIGINVRSAQRQREYDLHIEAAEKYLTELNYEQAIVEYTLALEIEPNAEKVLDALEQTYLDYAQSLADAGNYEKAISVLEEGYAQTGRERLQEKLEELKTVQAQKEAEARRLAEEAAARMIEFPFELTDISIMGYDLFTDHYEDVCAAYGCPIDTDPSQEKDSTVDNEYGYLSSDVSLEDDGEYKGFAFYQSTETISYPALSYSSQKYSNNIFVDISIYSSFDKVADLASCGIDVPAPTGSYEDWSRMLKVQEIKEKGELQETEAGVSCWEFLTKWGTAYYTENTEYDSANLEIYLNDWTVGENRYNGIFTIDRYVDSSIGADIWIYGYRDFY